MQNFTFLAYEAFDAAMTASWRTLESIDYLVQPLPPEGEVEGAALFIASLCTIRNVNKFTSCVSRLSNFNPTAAIELSLASAHLGLCIQYISTERVDEAKNEAALFSSFALAASFSCGFRFSYFQEQWLRNRANTLPAKIESQQKLGLAIKLGRLPSKYLFVLGMHRSGTSALTGMLSKTGLDAPSDLMSPGQDNPKGYYESIGIVAENDQLLANFKSNWTLEKPLPQGWSESDTASLWRSSLIYRLEASYRGAEYPVIKDPRFCLLLDGIDCWLQDYSVEANFILLIRDPIEVVSSLLARPNFPISRRSAFKLWIESILTAEKATRHFERIVVMADDLFSTPDSVKINIQNFLELSRDHEKLNNTSSFIDPSLRHQHRNLIKRSNSALDSMQCDNLERLAIAIYTVFKSGETCINQDILNKYRYTSSCQ